MKIFKMWIASSLIFNLWNYVFINYKFQHVVNDEFMIWFKLIEINAKNSFEFCQSDQSDQFLRIAKSEINILKRVVNT